MMPIQVLKTLVKLSRQGLQPSIGLFHRTLSTRLQQSIQVPLEQDKTLLTNNEHFKVRGDAEKKLRQEMFQEAMRHPDYFGVATLFTVTHLFDARVHLAHKMATLNDHMRPYIFGSRLGHLIFDLDATAVHLRQALNFIAHMAYRNSIILFVNRNRQTIHMVERFAKEAGEYAHCRSHNAFLTNSQVVFGDVIRLPDLIIFLNTKDHLQKEHLTVRDAAATLIPTVGIVDSDCDPTLISYPIPGNDETPQAVELFARLFKEAILLGKQRRKKDELTLA